jgi:RNA polymerase sigma-70 factor (ECF subfamily)
LPDDQRLAVELHHLRDTPVAEIAAHLGRTEASVAGLLRRGLQKLRELLQSREE